WTKPVKPIMTSGVMSLNRQILKINDTDIGEMIMKKMIFSALVLASVAPVAAQAAYPDRPVSLVVPYAPGGTADALARVIAQHLGKKLDQSVVVENKPGASGIIGQSYVARAKADGYTLLYDATPLAINPAVNKLNFDPK